MFQQIVRTLTDPQVLLAAFSAVAVGGTVFILISPMLERDRLTSRMRAVAIEREKLRARERTRLANEANRASLRREPKAYMRSIVERFNLRHALADEGTTSSLRMAGFRGQAPLVVFLFARVTLPIVFFGAALFYLFVLGNFNQPPLMKFAIAIFAAYAGLYAPILYVKNIAQKRQTSIRRAWPDALDLLLICVETGMGAEPAFRRVAEEIGAQSPELAEELMLTTAELSYLQERRQAYENFGARTGIDSVKGVMTALIQAERYGTPLGNALRVLAQESRDMRMNEAEKKAAALPPKLTVPMILFFLPVLFGVIIGPAAIQVMHATN